MGSSILLLPSWEPWHWPSYVFRLTADPHNSGKVEKIANFLSFTYGPYDMVPTSPIWYGRTQSDKNAKNYFLTNSYMKMHFGVSYVVILKYGEIRKKYSHIKTTRSRSGLKYRVLDLFRLINLSSWIHHWPRRSLCVFNLVIKIFESLN